MEIEETFCPTHFGVSEINLCINTCSCPSLCWFLLSYLPICLHFVSLSSLRRMDETSLCPQTIFFAILPYQWLVFQELIVFFCPSQFMCNSFHRHLICGGKVMTLKYVCTDRKYTSITGVDILEQNNTYDWVNIYFGQKPISPAMAKTLF